MDDDIAALVKRVRAYARLARCAESVASLRVFNDGKRLTELEAGSKMWPDTVTAALARLDALEAELAGQ
jgi:hypothetical protein